MTITKCTVLVAFLLGILSPWRTASADDDFSVTNVRHIDLTAKGLRGTIIHASLSGSGEYISIETRSGNERHLYVYNIKSAHLLQVDPRSEISGYDSWEASPVAALYPRFDGDANWYPSEKRDGEWLVFASNGIDNQKDLFLYRARDAAFVRMTNTDYNEVAPAWSVNGDELAYMVHGSVDELYTVSGIRSMFGEIQKLQMSYDNIPNLADIYSKEIFDGTRQLHYSTTQSIVDFAWVAGGNIALLQADTDDTTAVRLYYLRDSGKSKFISERPLAAKVRTAMFGEGVLILKPDTNPKSDRMTWFGTTFAQESFDRSIPREGLIGSVIQGDGLVANPLVLNRYRMLLPERGERSDILTYRIYTKGRIRDRNTGIEVDGDIRALDVNAVEVGDRSSFKVCGAYERDRSAGIFICDFVYFVAEEDEPLFKENKFVDVGLQAHFSKFTGDVVPGDFLPGFGLWAEIQFTGGLANFSTGAKLGYAPLGGSRNDDVSFEKYFWAASAYIKYTYQMMYEFQPYASLGVGLAASNSVQFQPDEPRKRLTPFYFDLTAGGAFTIDPRTSVHVIASFVKLSEDIDRLAKEPKTDSYLLIGVGFSYTLLF